MPQTDSSRRTLNIIIIATCIVGISSAIGLSIVHKQSGAPPDGHISPRPTASTGGGTDQEKYSNVRVVRLPNATGEPSELLPLGKKIQTYIDKFAPNSSVYLEDLNAHIGVNIGRSKPYNAKSLMKVPLVMSLYKAVELERLKLDEVQTIASDQLDASFGSLHLQGAGAKVTLGQAVSYALQRSDNTAMNVINKRVFQVMEHDERSYIVMRLDMQTDADKQTFISARSYAAVFRCLHEACYLNRPDSDNILKLMKNTDFTAPNKLLPAGVEVSHKIGNVNGIGFNDCGIVYGSKKPFIFCIMLNETIPRASEGIAQVTKTAYDFFEK